MPPTASQAADRKAAAPAELRLAIVHLRPSGAGEPIPLAIDAGASVSELRFKAGTRLALSPGSVRLAANGRILTNPSIPLAEVPLRDGDQVQVYGQPR